MSGGNGMGSGAGITTYGIWIGFQTNVSFCMVTVSGIPITAMTSIEPSIGIGIMSSKSKETWEFCVKRNRRTR